MNNEFIYKWIFPEPKELLSFSHLELEELKENCIYVLDASTLLALYGTGSKSLSLIENVYKSLKSDSRLVVPAQAAREFLANRQNKLLDLYGTLSSKYSHSYPF